MRKASKWKNKPKLFLFIESISSELRGFVTPLPLSWSWQ
jgi:hypothetical protein